MKGSISLVEGCRDVAMVLLRIQLAVLVSTTNAHQLKLMSVADSTLIIYHYTLYNVISPFMHIRIKLEAPIPFEARHTTHTRGRIVTERGHFSRQYSNEGSVCLLTHHRSHTCY